MYPLDGLPMIRLCAENRQLIASKMGGTWVWDR